MEILRFNKNNKDEYKKFIGKYNNVPEFNILDISNFNFGEKEIFLAIEKGIMKKYKILAYSIIEKDLKNFYIANSISEKYKNDGTVILISDFIVKEKLRRHGIGSEFAQYLIDEIFLDKDIILQPDGDGYEFWKRFGFETDNISEKETWKIERVKY